MSSAQASKFGDSNREDDVLNHDQCDSCGDGGDLLCCDNCPRSFHFDCLNPPVDPDDENLLKGDWYCNACKSKKGQTKGHVPLNATLLAPLFLRLEATNPRAFSLPSEVKNSVNAEKQDSESSKMNDWDKNGDEESKPKRKPPKPKSQTVKDETCHICSLSGDLLSCCLCSRTYHLFCLDPPLLFKPVGPWRCPNHLGVAHIIPDKSFKLDFSGKGPHTSQSLQKTSNAKGGKRKNLLDDSVSDSDCSAWLIELSRSNTSNEVKSRYLDLQAKQEEMLRAAMPGSQFLNPDSLTLATPSVLSQLTPLFTQFLAWQRLMEINHQIQEFQQLNRIETSTFSSYVDARLLSQASLQAPPHPSLASSVPSLYSTQQVTEPVAAPNVPTTTPIATNGKGANSTATSNAATATATTASGTINNKRKSTPENTPSAANVPNANGSTKTTKKQRWEPMKKSQPPVVDSLKNKPMEESKKTESTSSEPVSSIHPSEEADSKLRTRASARLQSNTKASPAVATTPTPTAPSAPSAPSSAATTPSGPVIFFPLTSPQPMQLDSLPLAKPSESQLSTSPTVESRTVIDLEADTTKEAENKQLQQKAPLKNVAGNKPQIQQKSTLPAKASALSKGKVVAGGRTAKNRSGANKALGYLYDPKGKLLLKITKKETIIGRQTTDSHPVDFDMSSIPDIRFSAISRRHAAITYNEKDGRFTVTNFGRNGTKVGIRVLLDEGATAPLDDKTVIEISRVRMLFSRTSQGNESDSSDD